MDLDQTICFCRKVSAQDIKDAVDNGAKTVEEVQEATTAATVCGRCKSKVEACMKEFLEK